MSVSVLISVSVPVGGAYFCESPNCSAVVHDEVALFQNACQESDIVFKYTTTGTRSGKTYYTTQQGQQQEQEHEQVQAQVHQQEPTRTRVRERPGASTSKSSSTSSSTSTSRAHGASSSAWPNWDEIETYPYMIDSDVDDIEEDVLPLKVQMKHAETQTETETETRKKQVKHAETQTTYNAWAKMVTAQLNTAQHNTRHNTTQHTTQDKTRQGDATQHKTRQDAHNNALVLILLFVLCFVL